MFKFFKEKLKSWLKSSEKTVELKAKPIKKQAKAKPVKKQKVEKRKRTKQELEQEREITEEVVEDIKKEVGEEIRTIPTHEEIIEELKAEEKTIQEKKPEKKGFFSRIFKGKYIISEQEFLEMFDSLELILLENNIALEAVDYLKNSLKEQLIGKEIDKKDIEPEIKSALKKSIDSLFTPGFKIEDKIGKSPRERPFIIAFFGINGSGKTTSIAKLAYKLKQKGYSIILAAADTFRAASIEQLKIHGEKLGVKVIHQSYGSDPAAVAYDAIEYAKSHKTDVVLIDTAGRMHTKENLIKEMGKIVRVAKPDLKIFVGEAITGNDATEQAKTFNEAISIDGIILSKQDVDEKGGTSLSVSYITKKPILYLGIGQEYKDLQEFDKEKLLKQLDL